MMVDFWNMVNKVTLKTGQPNKSRIIDFGSGTGMFCSALYACGIPRDCLIAVDKRISSHASQYSKHFWPIVYKEDFKHDYENDILFIAWGIMPFESVVDNFVSNGGKHVVIIGEDHPDMTFGWDYFVCERGILSHNIDVKKWSTQSIHVKGTASYLSERVSLNSCTIRFENDCGENSWNDSKITNSKD